MIHLHDPGSKFIGTPVKRVILAPHADDEVLGCGGLLKKYSQECAVVVMTRPDDIRMKEFQEAKIVLGYEDAYIIDQPDGCLDTEARRQTGLLDEIFLQLQPTEVYLPYPASHQDHIATYEAGIRASRLSLGSQHWYPKTIKVYDVCAYDVNLYASQLHWNVFETLTEDQINAKVEALGMYRSQMVAGFHPINGLKEISSTVGASKQTGFVEQFALVREVLS